MNTKRDVIETWFRRVWKEEDTRAIDEIFVADGEARGLGENALIAPAGFKVFHAALLALLSEVVITVDKSVEEGDWISVICTLQARNRQTNAPVGMTGHVLVRVVDGRILEGYNHWDFLRLFSDLSLLPPKTFETALAGKTIT